MRITAIRISSMKVNINHDFNVTFAILLSRNFKYLGCYFTSLLIGEVRIIGE
jgi:hypothetical protein